MRSTTFKLCITLSLLIIVGIVVYGLFIMLIRSEILKIAQVEATAQERATYADENHKLKLLLDDIAPSTERLNSRYVGSDETVPFIDSVESLARDANLKVTVNSIDTEPADKDGYQWIKINITTVGSWQAVYRYLSILDNLPYLSKVDATTVTWQGTTASTATAGSSTPKTKEASWRGDFTVEVFQQK